MKINVKDVQEQDDWTRQMDIEVDGAEVQDQIEDALKKLRRGLDLPGFRKGKVPLDTVRERFGRNVEAEVVERVVSEALHEALKEQDWQLIGRPRVEEIDFHTGRPLAFKALLDIQPALEVTGYDGLKIDKVVRPVEEEDIDSVLEELRMSRAEIEEVERPVAEHDVVTVNLSTLGPGQVPIVGSRRESLRLLLTPSAVPEGWIEALSGHQVGDQVVVAQPPPAGKAQQAREQGVVAAGGEDRYDQVEIVKVESRSLPELDDAFAAEVAQLETFDELRERVRSNLQEEGERRAGRELERQILDRLADPLAVEVPERVVRRGADELYESALRQHPNLDEEAREKLAVEAQKEATRRMRHELVVATVGRREGIEVTREEAAEAYQSLVKAGLEQSDDPASRERMEENLRDSLYERKVLKLLVDRADIQVIEQSRSRKRIVTPFDS